MRQHGAGEYGSDFFNDYVLDYIEQHQSQPFFIYYPMVLAHDPWVTTPDMRDENATDQQKFAAMMAYMDKMVGNVRDKVESLGLSERTLIMFIGDNGTGRSITSRQHGRDVPGAKGQTIDAGSRVPFMAWGPGLVDSGLVSDSLVNLNDILPTLVEFSGAALPEHYPGDGVSLAPAMRGEAELERENIFIHYEPFWPSGKPARYAFDRRWKLYENGGFYDMQADPLEKNGLDVGALNHEASVAYEVLSQRISAMPGELRSKYRWIPAQFYYYAIGMLMAVIAVLWLLRRLVRFIRR
jgi:arylsulfatase A-like enzyme